MFFLFQAALPFFIRFFLNRRAAPIYAQILAHFQDLLVISLLPLFPFFSFFHHLYLLFDAFLYTQMKLRMKFSFCLHIFQAKTLFHSAKELGLFRFLMISLALLLAHLNVPAAPFHFPLFLISIVGAILSLSLLPRSLAYIVNHPFFLNQKALPFSSSRRIAPLPLGSSLLDIKITNKPHIVFLFMESFPAKYVSATHTPRFHQLTQEGIFFSHFYSNGTLTYRAFISSLFGIPPGSTASGLSPYLKAPLKGIPQFLKEKGYKTAFHHNGSLKFDSEELFLKSHFDVVADQTKMRPRSSLGWGIPDEELMKYSIHWLEEQKTPAFLTMFTISNHHPWIVPNHYAAPQATPFLQTLHYSDYALGLFVDLLKQKGLSKNTLLFILGDHGQPMGEHHNNFYNSRFLYEENVKVPLLFLAEGQKPLIIDQPGSQMDLLPTLMDLFGTPQSASLLRSQPAKTLFLQNPYSEGFVGCRQGKWKWIENRLTAEQELYNLEEDPEEKVNLANSHSTQALKEQTHSFFAEVDQFYQGTLGPSTPYYCLDKTNSLITDAELLTLASTHIFRVSLENCLLLTTQGIANFCSQCPNLEELNLKGLEEISDALFEHLPHTLKVLDLSDARELSDAGIQKLTHLYLQELSLNIKNISNFPLRNLIRLKLYNASHWSDNQLTSLAHLNPNLGRLVIYNSNLTDNSLSTLKTLPLEMLWLYGSSLTEQGKKELESLPIRNLALISGEHK